MQLLDWLVVATVSAIVLVLADGFRRKWLDRRNRVVMKLDPNIPKEDVDLDLLPNSELPNGGARTVTRESEPVIPRKRYNLKDGRDRVAREPGPESSSTSQAAVSAPIAAAESVPVLMDPVDIEETDIEHANVFVTAEPATASHVDSFDDEELPPEVAVGLSDDLDSAVAPSTAEVVEAVAVAMEERDVLFESYGDADNAYDDRLPDEAGDELQEEGLMDELADQFVATGNDPLAGNFEDEEEFDEEFDDGFEGELENEAELMAAEEARASELASEAGRDEEAGKWSETDQGEFADDEQQDDQTNDEEDEEYDPYDDEHNYENEPALLENAYRLAASHFQRPAPSSEPRIEPGFGEAKSDEVEPVEAFGVLDEQGMDAFLDEEREEIRAWRTQSVTQQAARAAAEREAAQVKPVPATAAPRFETPIAATPPVPSAPATPVVMEQPPAEAADVPAPASKSVKSPRENKPGFWETVTSMGAKAASMKPSGFKSASGKPTVPKAKQGELFQEEVVEEPVVESGPQEVIIVNVMAKPGSYFYGDELLPVLQHYGLRLGNMNVFHRHTEPNGNGPVMFSMANMVKPGTFALSDIETFATPGISFFVQLPNRHGNMKAFELMLATANAVKEAMDGDLKDERRSVLTRQTVEHCRQRVRDFELSLLAKK